MLWNLADSRLCKQSNTLATDMLLSVFSSKMWRGKADELAKIWVAPKHKKRNPLILGRCGLVKFARLLELPNGRASSKTHWGDGMSAYSELGSSCKLRESETTFWYSCWDPYCLLSQKCIQVPLRLQTSPSWCLSTLAVGRCQQWEDIGDFAACKHYVWKMVKMY